MGTDRRTLGSAAAVGAVVVACLVVAASGCAHGRQPRVTARAASAESNGSLEWFGFVGVGCSVDDPHDDAGPSDYVDEVAGFTNIAHVCVFAMDMVDELAALAQVNVHAMLDVSALLFEWVDGSPMSGGPQVLRLRADAQTVWDEFVAINDEVLNADHVAAIYLVDEPVWNGATIDDIDRAAALVDTTFPTIPLMIVEAPGALPAAHFPSTVDWIGFDRYGVADPATDAAYQADVATMRTRSTTAQRHVLILDTQWLPMYVAVNLSPRDMADVANNYVAYARSTDDVVAIIGYSWPGGIDGPDHLGARNLPRAVVDTYVAIGRSIIE